MAGRDGREGVTTRELACASILSPETRTSPRRQQEASPLGVPGYAGRHRTHAVQSGSVHIRHDRLSGPMVARTVARGRKSAWLTDGCGALKTVVGSRPRGFESLPRRLCPSPGQAWLSRFRTFRTPRCASLNRRSRPPDGGLPNRQALYTKVFGEAPIG